MATGSLLTPRTIAERLSVHPHTVRRWLAEGRMASVRTPGGQYRVDSAELERLAKSSVMESHQDVA
jgi:excisionase family DNA binding protein